MTPRGTKRGATSISLSAKKPKSYAFIVAGPTGSGKTNVAKALQKMFKAYVHPYNTFLIDDLVMSDPSYVIPTMEWLLTIDPKDLERDLTNPSDEDIMSSEKRYFQSRKHGCDRLGENCDEVMDTSLDEAINDSENIVFETTFQHAPTWLFKKLTKRDYQIVIGISVVHFTDLVKRNTSRAANDARIAMALFHDADEEMRKYNSILTELTQYKSNLYGHFLELMRSHHMPFSPRLPDIRNSAQHQFFLIAVKQIYKSIYDEVMECSRKDCPVHNIVVFKPVPIDKSNPEGLINLLNIKYGKGSTKLLQKEGANDTFNYFSSSFY